MRDYAVAAGVLANRIILDDTSRTTFENLRHSLSIADSLGAAPDGSDIAIVTDGSPMTRTWLLTSYLGHHKAQLVTVDLFTKFSVKRRRTMIMREAAAWWYNLGKIMVWEALSLFRIPPEMRTRLVN